MSGDLLFAMQKKWILKRQNRSTVDTIMQRSGVPAVIATILAGRGITDAADINSFLSPSLAEMLDPSMMAGISQGVERLVAARKSKERLCIYGDYDVDGISATAMLVAALTEFGFSVCYHIPDRMEDGYGLNAAALRRIREGGVDLLISVDCGVTAIEEGRLCREIGLDLIITDHHQLLPELPEAVAVINPLRADCNYPFKGLAGVGVAFNLLVALRGALSEQGVWPAGRPDLRKYLDLVALGSIADLVPLTGQNRILVAAGLQRMGDGCRTGLAALKRVAGVKGEVSCGQVGFQLAPRLNAVGRLESAVPGVELLLTDNQEQAERLAAELDAANQERRQVESAILEQAVQMVESAGNPGLRSSIVLGSTDWHQGVVGIVASRLVERYHRPTVLIAMQPDGGGKGSGRSISGLHLLDALHDCADCFTRYGGHRMAAGLTLAPGMLERFAETFEQLVSERLDDEDLLPELLLDAVVTAEELNIDLARGLKRLEPFGIGNQTPLLLLEDVQITGSRIFGENHLQLSFTSDGRRFQAVGWRMGGVELPERGDLACTVRVESWNGLEQLKIELKGIRRST